MSFTVIPAMDIMAGCVALASAAAPERYGSLKKAHGRSDDPLRVLSFLVDRYGFDSCYVADLDALQGRSPQYQSISRLERAFPEIEFWLDSGRHADPLPDRDNWTRVLGREGVAGADACGGNYVLSLDFPEVDETWRLPPAYPAADSWPDRVILMELGVIGSDAGPNLKRLKGMKATNDMRGKAYASGGVRHCQDLLAIAAAGAAGALCATALHNGNISPEELSRLRSRLAQGDGDR